MSTVVRVRDEKTEVLDGPFAVTKEQLVCPVLYRGQWGMSSSRAMHGLAQLLRAAGCRPLSRGFHALRHSFATHFVRSGGSLVALQRLLGLTRAEALLVQALFAGRSLSAAAVTLRISRETAKTQLSCIFHKCRVKSQAQLTRLVAGGPFFSDPAGGNQPGLS